MCAWPSSGRTGVNDPMPIVMLHPVGLDRHCWDRVRVGRTSTPTYPGHPGRARAPYRLSDLADEIVSLHPGRLTIVGVSMGGIVAQHVALRHPRRVSSLVLACTTGATDAEAMRERAQKVESQGIEGVLEEILERWFSPAALRAGTAHAGVRYVRKTLLGLDAGAFADAWLAMSEHSVLDELPVVAVPVTCLSATDDLASPPVVMEQLQRRLRRSRLVTLPGPHMLVLEQPERFSQVVRDHVAWVAGGCRSMPC